jgi:hypothetical protein
MILVVDNNQSFQRAAGCKNCICVKTDNRGQGGNDQNLGQCVSRHFLSPLMVQLRYTLPKTAPEIRFANHVLPTCRSPVKKTIFFFRSMAMCFH